MAACFPASSRPPLRAALTPWLLLCLLAGNVLRSCCITGSAAAPGPSPVAAPAPLALVSAPQNVSQCPAGVVVDYAITSLDPIPGQAGAYQFASLVGMLSVAHAHFEPWTLLEQGQAKIM
jgi:hypothetical protein